MWKATLTVLCSIYQRLGFPAKAWASAEGFHTCVSCITPWTHLTLSSCTFIDQARAEAFLEIHPSLQSSCWSHNCSMTEKAVPRGPKTRVRLNQSCSQSDVPLTGVRDGWSFAERRVWRWSSVHLMPSERWSMSPGARLKDMTGAFINVSKRWRASRSSLFEEAPALEKC